MAELLDPVDHSSVILDNAFLFSVSRFCECKKEGIKIRNVHILGLSALADAIVMHSRLTVDRKGWSLFERVAPPRWISSIEPYVDIIDFELPPHKGILDTLFLKDEIASGRSAILLCYAMSLVDEANVTPAEGIRNLYLSYTGHVISNWGDEECLITDIKNRLHSNIPEFEFNLRSSQHVSTIQCLVRGIQYELFARERGQAYLCQEFRGRLLSFIGRCNADLDYRKRWDEIMKRMSSWLEGEYHENYIWNSTASDENHNLWVQLSTPIFLASALQKSETLDDLFEHVRDIRDKALPVRELLRQLEQSNTSNELKRLAKEAGELAQSTVKADASPGRSKMSIKLSFPPSASFNLDMPIARKNESVGFIRDIYQNFSIPYTLRSDIERVFGPVDHPLMKYDRVREGNLLEEFGDFFLSHPPFDASHHLGK